MSATALRKVRLSIHLFPPLYSCSLFTVRGHRRFSGHAFYLETDSIDTHSLQLRATRSSAKSSDDNSKWIEISLNDVPLAVPRSFWPKR